MARGRCYRDEGWLDMTVDQQLEDCWVCPVRRECLRYAFETKSTCVVMGGLKLPMNPLKRLPSWAQD